MNSLSPFLLLILTFAIAPILLTDACCPFPAHSFTAMTDVHKENFKCSEPVTLTCHFETVDGGIYYTGISGNITVQEGVKVTQLKKAKGAAVSVSLTCDTATNLWSIDNSKKKYSNVGCVMSNSGSTWIIY